MCSSYYHLAIYDLWSWLDRLWRFFFAVNLSIDRLQRAVILPENDFPFLKSINIPIASFTFSQSFTERHILYLNTYLIHLGFTFLIFVVTSLVFPSLLKHPRCILYTPILSSEVSSIITSYICFKNVHPFSFWSVRNNTSYKLFRYFKIKFICY